MRYADNLFVPGKPGLRCACPQHVPLLSGWTLILQSTNVPLKIPTAYVEAKLDAIICSAQVQLHVMPQSMVTDHTYMSDAVCRC